MTGSLDLELNSRPTPSLAALAWSVYLLGKREVIRYTRHDVQSVVYIFSAVGQYTQTLA